MFRHLKKLVFIVLMLGLLVSCSSKKNVASGGNDKPHTAINIVKPKTKGFQKKILDEASSWMGTPYAYARAEKGEGADCSGMVMQVYLTVLDCKLPRNSAKQAEFCNRLKKEEVEPGDLVFFATGKDPSRVSHVGIMLDSDSFIHSSTSKGVCISKVSSPYYTRTFMMYGRVPYMETLLSKR